MYLNTISLRLLFLLLFFLSFEQPLGAMSSTAEVNEASFDQAVKYVNQISKEGDVKLTDDQRLVFYKYFKQGTKGDCDTEKPGMLNFKERHKWDAWVSVKGMPTSAAKSHYVEELEKIRPNWREEAT